MQTRILFVDDEPGIRATLPEVLNQFGFNVSTAATVAEALRLVATQPFDALIADLNVGQPGDGFTVVSAMRRTQPQAITLILTGYPAFETALEAIRQQVDDYLTKPADIQTLVQKIKMNLAAPKAAVVRRIEAKRLAEILDQGLPEITRRWLAAAKEDQQIAATRHSDRELTDHVPAVMEEVVAAAQGQKVSEKGLQSAVAHGRSRFRQGCTIPSVMREARVLQQVLSQFIQENLLGADISSVIPGVMQIGEAIQAYFEASVREYLHARHSAFEHPHNNKGKSLLLLSGDLELGMLRAHALRHAGFFVTRADSRTEALALSEKKFDALVLSYSLPRKGVAEMAKTFREHNPTSPVITVTEGRGEKLDIDADFTLNGGDGPESLIEAVEAALNRKQLRRIK